MKTIYLIFVLFLFIVATYGQKPCITDTSYKDWTEVSESTISNNGKFVFYYIRNKPRNGNTFCLIATDNSWSITSTTYFNAKFTEDSRYLFAMQGDTLIKLDLKSKESNLIKHCKNYEIYKDNTGEWLIYALDDPESSLVFQNMITGSSCFLKKISEYFINKNGGAIISKSKIEPSYQEVLQWTDLKEGKTKIIYKGTESTRHIFDNKGSGLAFVTAIENENKVWYYNKGLDSAHILASNASPELFQSKTISTDNIWQFSTDGSKLFFTLKIKNSALNEERKNIKIWSYQDAYLRSQWDKSANSLLEATNLSVLDIEQRRIKQLLNGVQKLKNNLGSSYNTDILIVESSFGRADELPWNIYAHPSYQLLFTKTGEIRPLNISNGLENINIIQLSPDNKYLVYFNQSKNSYYSYNIVKDTEPKAIKIVEGCNYYSLTDRGREQKGASGITGWVANQDQVIIQGTYNLWVVDLKNNNSVANLTPAEGLHKNILFAFLNTPDDRIIIPDKDFLVSGFHLDDKSYEIRSLNISNNKFKLLFKNPTPLARPYISTQAFKKAKNAECYIFEHQTANSSLNCIFTRDFKKFIALSKNYPEKKYNWMTSELVRYNDEFGNLCEGVLYKPENFNKNKKYPIILSYYLDVSNEYSEYLFPELSSDGINIPLLVSNGYIFFKPNIYRIPKQPGQAALISVLAAANYLSKFSWADSTKMAISGHSYGGYETNYIVSHCNKFAAAYSAAGTSNMFQGYNDLWGSGFSKQSQSKFVYLMIDGLEQIPTAYFDNSPIVSANNINTPLLLLHNTDDQNVPVVHSIQLFVQLRSLNKPVWLLQYKGEQHVLSNEDNQLDAQAKVKSFFDHYLMNRSRPNWMSKHISPPTAN